VTLEGLYDNDDCPWDDPTFDVSSATGLAQSVTVTVVSTCLNLSQLVSTWWLDESDAQRVLKGDHQVIKGVGHSLGVSVVSTVTKEQNGTLPPTGTSKAQEAGAARYLEGQAN
jgi:hypothetical protein